MFNRKKIKKLEDEINSLQFNLECLKNELKVKYGPYPSPLEYWAERNGVPVKDAIQCILDHLGLEIGVTQAVPKAIFVRPKDTK